MAHFELHMPKLGESIEEATIQALRDRSLLTRMISRCPLAKPAFAGKELHSIYHIYLLLLYDYYPP